MLQPWWKRWPDLLDLELKALERAGIPNTLDPDALAAGVVKLRVTPLAHGRRLNLTAIFPDFYPYVRPEVIAPDLELPRHQHPVSMALCLIGRATANWVPGRTLAEHLQSQLPKLFAVLDGSPGADGVLEEQQAEPYSDYYPCAENAMILIDSDWRLPADLHSGRLEIGLDFEGDGTRGLRSLRGAVLRVADLNDRTLAEADSAVQDGVFKRTIAGRWFRFTKPIPVRAGGAFGIPRECVAAQFQPVGSANIDITALLFPEDLRTGSVGTGWVFVLRIKRPGFDAARSRSYLVRGGRAGRADMAARIPEVRSLTGSTIAVLGLGALGAPSALEFARAGIGKLHILDCDFVDPAASVRWPLGLAAAGALKTDAISDFIARHYPHSLVRKWNHRLGGVADGGHKGPSDAQVLTEFLDGVDLVYDATAELGLQHLVADLCEETKLPYVGVSATEGGWGGLIMRVRPGRTNGCWMCLQHAIQDQTIPLPPANPSGSFQPVGCADPTFTGSAFDLQEVALAGVRLTVATLSSGDEGLDFDWDIGRLALRDSRGRPTVPQWETSLLDRHPSCEACQRRAA